MIRNGSGALYLRALSSRDQKGSSISKVEGICGKATRTIHTIEIRRFRHTYSRTVGHIYCNPNYSHKFQADFCGDTNLISLLCTIDYFVKVFFPIK